MTGKGISEKFIDGLTSRELLLKLDWDEWLAIQPPHTALEFTSIDATVRFQRNGYDWDMHGTV